MRYINDFQDLNQFSINNVWKFLREEEELLGYTVTFGNLTIGWHFNTNEFNKFLWRFLVKMSYGLNGDISLYYNGNIIRSVINAKEKILNKNIQYPIRYNKYDI